MMSKSVITVADEAFALLVARPAPLAFDTRDLWDPGTSEQGLPDGLVALDELRDLLVRRVVAGPAADAVWRRLAFQAREWGPEWVVGAVGVAVPALRMVTARLAAGRSRLAEDIDAEALAGFLEALRGERREELDAPRLWVRLMWAAWRAGLRAAQVPDVVELPEELPGGSSTPHPPYGHPDLLLGRAVALGVISVDDAELISETRLGDVFVESVAARQDTSAAALRMRRVRAEHRVVESLRRGELSAVQPRPVAATRRNPQTRRGGIVRRPRPRACRSDHAS